MSLPSIRELKKEIQRIVEDDVDLLETSAKDIRKLLEESFEMDLSNHKVMLKTLIMGVINNIEENKDDSFTDTEGTSDSSCSESESCDSGTEGPVAIPKLNMTDISKKRIDYSSSSDDEVVKPKRKSNRIRLSKREEERRRKEEEKESDSDYEPIDSIYAIPEKKSHTTKFLPVSTALASIVGAHELPISLIKKRLLAYVVKNKLVKKNYMDIPRSERRITCDNQLRNLFQTESDTVEWNHVFGKGRKLEGVVLKNNIFTDE